MDLLKTCQGRLVGSHERSLNVGTFGFARDEFNTAMVEANQL